MKISKTRYLQGFGIVVVILGMVRCVYPRIATGGSDDSISADSIGVSIDSDSIRKKVDTVSVAVVKATPISTDSIKPLPRGVHSRFFKADGSLVKNRIYSVPKFSTTFPDLNDVQLAAAQKLGVKPVKDRKEAERRKTDLVYIGSNPYFYVDRLRNSIPYLVPRASVLLQDIGRSFYDSLMIKGVPLHKIVITSALRTQDDVAKLRSRNSNATANSAHQYGTTFDIAYNRYKTVEAPDHPRREVRNDTLKWIFSEVLRDIHEQGRCYIKYEVKQGCFHITVR